MRLGNISLITSSDPYCTGAGISEIMSYASLFKSLINQSAYLSMFIYEQSIP